LSDGSVAAGSGVLGWATGPPRERCADQPARWSLLWNNPKLHEPDRRKTWLACDQHRGSLGDFLDVRGFLRDVAPLD
jgi:hypothetical protein